MSVNSIGFVPLNLAHLVSACRKNFCGFLPNSKIAAFVNFPFF